MKKTHRDVGALWLVKALRLILGLLLTAGSSFAFTAVEVAVGKGKVMINKVAGNKEKR